MTKKTRVVLKFGGTSVADRSNWNNIAVTLKKLIKSKEKPLVVCSALSQVSNKLERVIELAPKDQHQDVLKNIKEQHINLAKELEIEWSQDLEETFEALSRLCLGASLISDMQPNLKARILSFGEILSTKMGTAFLNRIGVSSYWLDARVHLKAIPQPTDTANYNLQHFLASPCVFDEDSELISLFDSKDEDVFLTQGFIASDAEEQTVLLGRGGSDVSAAYFAAKLKAERLEIWTSVPGMFTANPHQIETAKLLMHLDYDEAQELASSGAKVLHPRCIEPVARYGIPLHVKWTDRPEHEGTIIDNKPQGSGPKIKAVSSKKGVQIISMDTVGMWQQSGFLADIFNCFKKHNLSVDQIATSETNVTVTLENISQVVDDASIEALCNDLRKHCHPTVIGPCATLSIVGKKIRSLMHRLGAAFSALEEKEVFLQTQAASDLNFSITVPESEAENLLEWLHGTFFHDLDEEKLFGPRWNQITGSTTEANTIQENYFARTWWKDSKNMLLNVPETPAYVYNLNEVEAAADRLLAINPIKKVHFAMKANSHPAILKLLYRKGISFDCVSWKEIEFLKEHIRDLDHSRILFTPNFAPLEEYKTAVSEHILVTVDNIELLRKQPQIFSNSKILLRVDSDISGGHHTHVKTAGIGSKFGIRQSDLPEVKEICKANNIDVFGLHSHVGSGVKDSETWAKNAMILAQVASIFDTVKVLDIGGGLGVPTKPNDRPFDTIMLKKKLEDFTKANPNLSLWIEPGRYLVAEAGVLLAKVTQTKGKASRKYVGIETGMNSLIRQPLYGAHHEIFNLSKIDEPESIIADIVGPICESGDVLGFQRKLPDTDWNDTILIANAGAYGRVMASSYNMRQPAKELTIYNGEWT